jgi:hypothetical protein
LSLSRVTPKTCPTWLAVTGARCGSLYQWSPCGGRPGERTSMMLAEAPAGSITVISPPPGAGAVAVPEKRVTTASPGRSGSCCAKADSAAAGRTSVARRHRGALRLVVERHAENLPDLRR